MVTDDDDEDEEDNVVIIVLTEVMGVEEADRECWETSGLSSSLLVSETEGAGSAAGEVALMWAGGMERVGSREGETAGGEPDTGTETEAEVLLLVVVFAAVVFGEYLGGLPVCFLASVEGSQSWCC